MSWTSEDYLRWSLLALIWFWVSPLAQDGGQALPKTSSPALCYAFLRSGDIWTECQGKRERISLDRKADDFAISVDGAYLVIQEVKRHSDTRQSAASAGLSLRLISLQGISSDKTLKIDAPGFLYRTCGTVIFFDYGSSHPLDVLTSTPVRLPPYEYFRCSSDRRVIAGWTEQDETESQERGRTDFNKAGQIVLRVSRPTGHAVSSILDPLAFDASPNGEYVANFVVPERGPAPQLCVTGSSAVPACVLAGGHQVSVSDSGEVLYWEAGDAVSGIRYWRVGQHKTTLLEKGADHPQWITTQVAAALHRRNMEKHGLRASPRGLRKRT